MRIYVSSTYEDLQEHRAAVAQVLQQMGHELVAMEHDTANARRPLGKCVADVREADAYVGIFAWSYGTITPVVVDPSTLPVELPDGVMLGTTSFTEAEYRAAKDPLVFLADPDAPWSPRSIDAVTGKNGAGSYIQNLRNELMERRSVAFFRTPADLASAVSAAVYRFEVQRQIDLRSVLPETSMEVVGGGGEIEDTTLLEIQSTIGGADRTAVVKIGLAGGYAWWSTRLYLVARLAADLTQIRQFVFVDGSDEFVGLASPSDVATRLAAVHAEIAQYESSLRAGHPRIDLDVEIERRVAVWQQTVGRQGEEQEVKAWARAASLRLWLGSSLVVEGVEWPDEEPSPELIQRLLDWPWPFAALVREGQFERVVDRATLCTQIARLFVQDQVARLRRT